MADLTTGVPIFTRYSGGSAVSELFGVGAALAPRRRTRGSTLARATAGCSWAIRRATGVFRGPKGGYRRSRRSRRGGSRPAGPGAVTDRDGVAGVDTSGYGGAPAVTRWVSPRDTPAAGVSSAVATRVLSTDTQER